MKVIALVIGIDHYSHPEFFNVLNCAVGDAKAVAEVFSHLKIEVLESYDEDDDVVREHLDEFTNKIIDDKPDVAIFYFAGHGERPNLKDGLVLKNARRSAIGETVLLGHCLVVNDIMQRMNAAGDQMNILILDACRNETRGVVAKQETGFKVPRQTFIAYSTTAGCTASDGKVGGHSPFTSALLNHIMTENLKVEDLFKQVRKDMFASGRKQYSWDYSCLLDDFSFNHGQLNRHYGSTYCFMAFSPTAIALTDALKSSFVQDINSSAEKKIDHAMSMLIAHKKDFKKEDLFIMGRYMLHASKSVFAAKYINITKLALLNIGNENPFFDGFLYEMFFDKEDNCRNKNIEGVWIFDEVAKVCDSPNFASSLTFIQKELEPFKDQVSYVPGNEVHTVRLFFEQSDLWQSSDKKIWIIDDVRFENGSVIDLLDETAYIRQSLRNVIKNTLRIPFRNLSIRSNEAVNDRDILIVGDLGYVDNFIDDYYHTNGADEFDELGHHLEFSNVENCEILDVVEYEGSLVVSGNFSISVIAYLDSEEEIKNDITLDGEFKISLEYDGNGWSVVDYDEMKLEAPYYLYQ